MIRALIRHANGSRPASGWRGVATALLLACAFALQPDVATAQTLQNHADGAASGVPLDTTLARVTLQRVPSTTIASVAEIAPNSMSAGQLGALFDLDVFANVPLGTPGAESLAVSLPVGFSGAAVVGVTLNGTPLTASCPPSGAGEYCATISSAVVTIAFGAPITVDPMRVTVRLALDGPAAIGFYTFGAALANAAGAVPSTEGDADGDAGDANTLSVSVGTVVDSLGSAVTAVPTTAVADGAAASVLTATLRDAAGRPLPGYTVVFSSNRGALDALVQPSAPTDANGVATGAIRSTTPGISTITATLPADSLALTSRPRVLFTQGLALFIVKTANRDRATIGDVVTYTVTIANTSAFPIAPVWLDDTPPITFRYLPGSATLNGVPLADPAGTGTLAFDLGLVPALVDGNGNGIADPGESGFMTLRYQVVVGSGATPGSYANLAQARDACAGCALSNTAEVRVTVVTEPVFSLGTILGRVFEDRDRDGLQDRDENGMAGTRVALDDGTVAITDRQGLYHFQDVSPGHRLVKVDAGSLSGAGRVTTSESQFVTVTSGLLAKANFGVSFDRDTVELGRPAVPGLEIAGHEPVDTVDVRGNVEDASAVINGRRVELRAGDAQLTVSGVNEKAMILGGRLEKPIEFNIRVTDPSSVAAWNLIVSDSAGHAVRRFEGVGRPPDSIPWDGICADDSLIEAGRMYQYQFAVRDTGGVRWASPMRGFGVERLDLVRMSIRGNAFNSGAAELRPTAHKVLHQLAEKLRRHPYEKIQIDGHTDNVGSREFNRELSLRRAQAVADYLSSVEGISSDRVELQGWGPDRPTSSNATAAGREQNRRIEVHSQGTDRAAGRLRDYFRMSPAAAVNDSLVVPDEEGRFSRRVGGRDARLVSISITDRHGRISEARVPLPDLEILAPQGALRIERGADRNGVRTIPFGAGTVTAADALASAGEGGAGDVVAECRLVGRTDPANVVTFDDERLPVSADSTFSADLRLRNGLNVFGLVVRNPEGISRLVTLPVRVTDIEPDGHPVAVVEAVPNLRVSLPPRGVKLKSGDYAISGVTDPGNGVIINDHPVAVAPDGSFEMTLALPVGRSRVVIQAVDSLGRVARVEREAEVDANQLFLVAIADGAVGRLQGGGILRDAVRGGDRSLYTEGRVAYYLKGVVRGRYLLTSAYDSGLDEFAPFFDSVDNVANDRLLTNLDPDRFYPVYGDSSTTVFDAPRRGRFYLGVESEELQATVGAAALSLDGGELANFQRTVSGAQVRYRTVARSRFGDPNTQVTLVGAQVGLAHVRDELRGTGGSLYYLSHSDMVEGGEQISLAIRDRETGLVRLRSPQIRGVDYTIDYLQGRLLFMRPVSSVAEAGSFVSHDPVAGDPVVIEAEYETRDGDSGRSLSGARARQQLGSHLAVGGTVVSDEMQTLPYQLRGVDGEVRMSAGSRVAGEVATSQGAGASAFVSDDGGLSFTERTPIGAREGTAWRTAIDLDAGEWLGRPNRLRLRGYLKEVDPDFVSSGTLAERGSRRTGAGAEMDFGGAGRVALRFDAERRSDSLGTSWNAGRSQLLGAQWRRDAKRWGLGAELQTRDVEDGSGRALDSSSVAAARLWAQLARRLTGRLEHQQGLRGLNDDRTTLGLQYQVASRLGLEAQGTSGTLGRSAQGRASLALGGGTVYLNERFSEERIGAGTTTVLGTQVPIGTASRVYSEYQWQRSESGGRELMLVGAQKQWQATKSFVVTLGGEHGEVDTSPTPTSRTAMTGSATFTHPAGVRLITQDEMRFERGARDRVQLLTSNQLEAKLPGGITALGRWRWSETRDRLLDRVEARFEEHGVGLAMRPNGDGPNALARFTRLADERPATSGTSTNIVASTMDVLAIEGTTPLRRRVDWTGKTALRVLADGRRDSLPFRTHSVLIVNRVNTALAGPFGIGVEYRVLSQREAADRRTGWLQELTWDAAKHIRMGAGFNFADFSDNEFSRNDSSVRGWFLRLQGRY